VLSGENRTATAEASSPIVVLRLDRYAFNEVARDVPQISFAIARELARRLELLEKQLAPDAEA